MLNVKETLLRYLIGASVFEVQKCPAGLYVVATPIGNLRDVTIRSLETLAGVERILCEDTRTTGKLLERYGIRTPLSPYHEHNARKVRPAILDELAGGAALAMVSDAGTPLVSDPGYRLVREAINRGVRVEAIPGPTAPLAALVSSGLPTDRFLFGGFLPVKASERQAVFDELRSIKATLIFFESPHRIRETIDDLVSVLGERPIAVARELTKLHEEILRGKAVDIAALLSSRTSIKGEITLIVGPPAEEDAVITVAEMDEALVLAAQGLPAGQAAAEVARKLGISRKLAYDRLLLLKGKSS